MLLTQLLLAEDVKIGDTPIPAVPIATGADFTLEKIITSIIAVFLIIIGILVVLYLVYGGVLYITAGGDAEKAGKGRTAITNAIIGLVIVIASYAIYEFVKGRTTKEEGVRVTPGNERDLIPLD